MNTPSQYDPKTVEQRRKRFGELLSAYFEARLPEKEAAELLELWQLHPEFEEQICDRYEMEHELTFLAKFEKRPPTFRCRNADEIRLVGRKPLFDKPLLIDEVFNIEVTDFASSDFPSLPSSMTGTIDFINSLEPIGEQKQTKRLSSRKKNEFENPLRRIIGLACLLTVLFFWGVYSEFRSQPAESETAFVEPIFLAEVTSAIDVQVGPENPPIKQGLRLETDRLRFESGTVELEISNGVRVVLEGPVDFKLNSAMQTLCTLGRLSVFVPPEGKGFEVATPHLTVQDLGTEFFINVTDKESECHVVKGEVVMNWFNGGWTSFNTGQAMRIDTASLKPTRFIAEAERFVSNNEVVRRLTDYFVRRQVVWEREISRRSTDSSLIFSLDKATVHGCDHVSGFHPNAKALRFRSVRDYAGMSVSGEHRNLTLFVMARLNEMKNFAALLCLGDGFPDEPGRFVWQLERTGKLLFHIRNARNVKSFDSPAVIKPGDWKTWLQLALVADAENREIRHYVDGRKVAALPWDDLPPLRMNSGTIGNERPEKHKKTVRNWNGEIDTFNVFSRALSDEEIAEMYNNMH